MRAIGINSKASGTGTRKFQQRRGDDVPPLFFGGRMRLNLFALILLATPVFAAPVIIQQPASVTVYEGATPMFSLGATGSGLTYQWYHNNSLIVGAVNSYLVLDTVGISASGDFYACIVTDDTAAALGSVDASLTVLREYSVSLNAQADELPRVEFLLQCIAFTTGFLAGSFSWFLLLQSKNEREFF